MPLDPDRLNGLELPEVEGGWRKDDVILYHLGLGAGSPPTDPGELAYTLEDSLKVLPSFAVIPGQVTMVQLIGTAEFDVDLGSILHGEQEVELAGPLPPKAKTVTQGRITGIYDKGKAALVLLEATTKDEAGQLLATSRFSVFIRGEGGFGGESGPPAADPAPDRPPDFDVDVPTLPQQGLLYRLNGDRNPLHAVPEFAQKAGFDRPILHGLCTYGIVCKAAVDAALDGDVTRVAGYRARFADVVFPGETVRVQVWQEPERLLVQAVAVERDKPVLTNAVVTLAG